MAASDVKPVDPAQEALDREPPVAWRYAKEGDQIIGTFLRVEVGTTGYGPAPVVILVDDDGKEWSIWLFAEALKSGFDRLRPGAGERIGVRYLGEEKSKNPKPGKKDTYHNFKVVAPDRTAGPVDWDRTLASTPPVDEDGAPF